MLRRVLPPSRARCTAFGVDSILRVGAKTHPEKPTSEYPRYRKLAVLRLRYTHYFELLVTNARRTRAERDRLDALWRPHLAEFLRYLLSLLAYSRRRKRNKGK